MGDRSNANGGLVNRIPTTSVNLQNIANARLYFGEVRKCFEYSKSCKIELCKIICSTISKTNSLS
jgi:hypothetical protein